MSLDSDPLFNQKNAFYKGLYQRVIDEASSLSGAEALVLRARLELDPSETATSLRSKKDPLSQAALALALHKTGKTTEALKIAEKLSSLSDQPDVQIIVASVLAHEPESQDDAIDILENIESNLEAIAIIIQICLANNQLARAQATLKSAKSWAQDAELIQLAEMWVNMRLGGMDNYQSAFYTAQEFADLAGNPTRMLLAQSAAEIQLGHYDEAESTLQNVLQKDSVDIPDALANMIVLRTLTGKDTTDLHDKLTATGPNHSLVRILSDKMTEFDTLKAAYSFVEV